MKRKNEKEKFSQTKILSTVSHAFQYITKRHNEHILKTNESRVSPQVSITIFHEKIKSLKKDKFYTF